MLLAREEDIVQIEVVPYANGSFAVAYVTSDGKRWTEEVGSKQDADDAVARVIARLNTSDELDPFPRDIAAS